MCKLNNAGLPGVYAKSEKNFKGKSRVLNSSGKCMWGPSTLNRMDKNIKM